MNAPMFDAAVLQPLFALVLAALVVMGSPGPAVLSVAGVGAAYGLRRSMAYTCGIIAGTSLVLLAVAGGLMSLLLAHPRLGPVLIVASGCYMVYLAFRIATAPPLGETRDVKAPGFAGGLLLALANPKAWLALGAVFTGTTIDAVSQFAGSAIKIGVMIGMIAVINLCWLVAGSSFARLLRQPAMSRAINVLFAVLLLASTAWPLLY